MNKGNSEALIKARTNIEKRFVGKEDVVEKVLICLLNTDKKMRKIRSEICRNVGNKYYIMLE